MPNIHNPFVTLLSTNTVLSSAQIQQLHTTPVTIIPAPGTGLVIIPIEVVAVLNAGTVQYSTSGGDSLNVQYSPTAVAFALAFSNFITRAANSLTSKVGSPLTVQPISPVANPIDNNSVQVNASNNYNFGPILTATLAAGGTGYVVNDTGTITTGNGNATYIVTSVGAGGAVTGFTVTSAGTGYVTANGVATAVGGAQPGVGTGFQVNITAVNSGNGTLRVVAYYTIIPAP